MRGSILITNTQSDFGKNLAEVFAREGFEVFTPHEFEKITKLDFLADTTDFRDESDDFKKTFRANVVAPMATLEKFLPLLDAGETRRIFYVTSAEASINETRDAENYAYKMSKAALHQFLQMVRNRLAPEGYTLRIFDPMPGKIDAAVAAESAFLYITRRRGTENDDPLRDDEEILIMRDAEGRAHGW
ncbi:MAG: SDR family NAD(P)-dependent oxidoreductase [Defluviitaleaceae bacterium]|nr:SDR family NAD(P)-dependent oxidoreductase [Defluviitaleaceae bacterium]